MKRLIITILLSCVLLAAAHSLYFPRVIQVNVPLQGKGSVNVELTYQTKNERKTFKKKAVLNNDSQNVTFNIQLKKANTLTVTTSSSSNNLSASKFSVNDKKFYDITQSAHDIKGIYRFNWKIFVILATFVFLVCYKLVQYISLFKIKHNASRIDIVFVCAFFIVLFVPMMHIDTSETSQKENRALAKYIHLFTDGKINNDYGKNFESYFNDRFFGRRVLIKANAKIQAFLLPNQGNDKVLIGKDDWLFYKGDNSVANFQNLHNFSESQMSKIRDYLSDIDAWCKRNGKQFVFLIAPDKNKVYGEFYPKSITKTNPDDKSRAHQLVEYLKQNSDVKVIYPLDILLDNKNHLLYYKNDTHWNEMGAYIGYKEIMKALNLPALDITETDTKKFENGDLYKMYSDNLKPDTKTVYTIPKLHSTAKCDESNEKEIYCTNDKNKKSAIVFRDSFTVALLPYISNTFNKTAAYWRYDITAADLKYIQQNADVVILEVVERYVPRLTNFTFPKEN